MAGGLKRANPDLVEDEFFRPHDTAVISIPQKSPQGSILRHESVFQMLERVKKVSQEWVRNGHRTGQNTHNVSATVSIKEDEWDLVGDWMWNNREFYNGLSVLPYNGGTYTQAPFTDCTEEDYESSNYNQYESFYIDLSKQTFYTLGSCREKEIITDKIIENSSEEFKKLINVLNEKDIFDKFKKNSENIKKDKEILKIKELLECDRFKFFRDIQNINKSTIRSNSYIYNIFNFLMILI